MRKLFAGAAILLVATPLVGAQAAISKTQPVSPGRLDFAVTYGATYSGTVGGSTFWMQGGSIQVHGQFYRGLGAMADVSGLHAVNIQSSGVGLDIVTATFGPRYTWSPMRARYGFYGQALVGVANGFHSIFPSAIGATDSSDSLAIKLGGGLNVTLTYRIALRALEADWLRTQLPNSRNNTQNNSQLGAGVVVYFW